MQQTPATLPPLSRGCFWHAVQIGHGTEQAECRWEDIEDGEGDVVGRLIVIEAVFFGGALVKAQHWPETLIDRWAEDIAEELDDSDSPSEREQQAQMARALAHYSAMAAEAVRSAA